MRLDTASTVPSGAATEATLAAIQTLIDALATLAETQPVSLASLPTLPAGGNQIGSVAQGAPTGVGNSWPVLVTDGVDTLLLDSSGRPTVNINGTVPVSVAATVGTKETRAATSAVTSVADTASSTTLLASNAARLAAAVFNDSTVALYLKLGAAASTSSFTVKLQPDGYYEVPGHYTGEIAGIWASDASGSARITELSA